MDTIDKVLLEWSLKTDKGYPDLNSKEDMALFESMFGFKLNEEEDVQGDDPNRKPDEQLESEKTIESIVADRNLSKDQQNIIKNTFYALSEPEQKNLLTNYLDKFTVGKFKSNLKSIVTALKPFYVISFSTTGVGRGEFIPLLAIKEAKSGGTKEKDVNIGSVSIEVKELANKVFKTAASGTATGSNLRNNIQTFFKYGVENDIIAQAFSKSTAFLELKKRLIEYYNGYYAKGGLAGSFRKDMGAFSMIVQKHESDITKENEKDRLDYLKVNGKRYTYTQTGNTTFEIGREVSKEEADLVKFLKHRYYIESTEAISDDLEKIKEAFLDSIDYILLYQEKGETPVMLSSEEAKAKITVQDINQGNVRLKYVATSADTLNSEM